MERVLCDVCNRDITRGVMLRSPDVQQKITVDTGYGILTMELCNKCWERLLYLLENDRYKEAVVNMGFSNRVRLALMLPLKYGKPDKEE